MSEYRYLIGADDVKSAGHAMSGAAEDMRQAAGNFDDSLKAHQRFLDDWLIRFENVLSDHAAKAAHKEVS